MGSVSTMSRETGRVEIPSMRIRYTESTSGPIIKPQWPLVFDLIDDPGEGWDLMDKRMDCIWVLGRVIERLATLQKSAARYPNIKPGEELTGYS